MEENTIKALFYNFRNTDVKIFHKQLEKMEYNLISKETSDLSTIKSEIQKLSWDILIVDKENVDGSLHELIESVNNLQSDIIIIIVVKDTNPGIVKLVFQSVNTDLVIHEGNKQICLALIRNFEKSKSLKQLDFTKKELLRTQKTQNEHEYFLTQVIESTSNPIFYKGREGRYLGCNTAFADFLGLPKEKILGKTVFEVSPEPLAKKYYEMDQDFFRNPVTQTYEYQAANSKGDLMDVIFYKSALRDGEGNVVGLLGHMFDITDRKKLEREMLKEKELAQLVLDLACELYLTLDLNGNITSVNKKTCSFLNAEKEDLIGKNWFTDFLPKENIDHVKKIFKAILDGNTNLEEKVEGQVITFLGEIKSVMWTNQILKNDDGKVIGTLSLGREIIDDADYYKKLEESEKKYQILVENMQEGIGISDLDETVVFCNPSFDKIFGMENDSMRGKNLRDYISKDDLDLMFKETNKRKQNKKSQYKLKIKREDDKDRTISVSSVPWKNPSGKVVGSIALINDITAQEYATKQLEKRVKIEQSIINISSQFISSKDFQAKLEATLNELRNIIEAERYAVLLEQDNRFQIIIEQDSNYAQNVKPYVEYIPFEMMEHGLNMLSTLEFIFYDDVTKLPDDAKEEKELLMRSNIFNLLALPFYSGSTLAGLLTIMNIYDANEWTIEDLSSLRTVTEIIGHAYSSYKAEEKAKQLNLDLITKNKELEQVVYVTSHDIRSPVVNILGFSDEMVKAIKKLADKIFDESNTIQNKEDIEFLLNQDVPQILNFIKISGQKIDKLLLALLKLSRLGRAAINKVNVNVDQLIRSLLDTFEYRISQENIKIEIDELPNCYTDEVQLNQVFSNLIDNAIKYKSPEREAVIRISGIKSNNKVTYCIQDNGIGISEKELDKIFDVFYRINPESQDGEGIGLSLIKKTIEKLDGSVSVGSEYGKGTSFYISLPKANT